MGHKRLLLISTAVTALGSWWPALSPTFTTFLIGWAIQSAYVGWLPLEIAIFHRRTGDSGRQELLTRRGAPILVGSLDATSEEVAPLSGYLTVWAVCAGAAFLAALALMAAPQHAFSDAPAKDAR